MHEQLLQGRVALVTGASRGIGAATATLLARHGAAVGVNYFANRSSADEVVAAIEDKGGRAVAVPGSAGDPEQVDAMVRGVVDAFGPVDTLVLNADAVEEFTVAPFTDLTWGQFEDLVVGETSAVFVPAKAVVPSMIEQGRGAIIAVSSGLSRLAQPGMIGHSAGKSAVDAMVRALATELGPHGIRVNTVAPGAVETAASASVWQGASDSDDAVAEVRQQIADSTPIGRIARPEDVAGAIVLLASDAAGFVTGAYLPVNGGAIMH